MKLKVLIIGLIWPEPSATAAGVRMIQLIEFFQYYNFEIVFCSSAKKSDLSIDLEAIGVKENTVRINDSSFDTFISELKPDFVVFDRFLTEEQFGWRIEDICPTTLRILDTEDLHFLREGRKNGATSDFTESELAKREIASMYRCDLSLIISEYEMEFLKNEFKIPDSLLAYLPFLENSLTSNQLSKYPRFDERHHFISIGNFKHEPNWKAVLNLKKSIWPLIRKALPEAEMHVYGAYAPQKAFDLHNSSEGFIVKGWTPDIETVYTRARICLAPLEFGAGIKGKLMYSMKYGTPNITFPMGAEGMQIKNIWNGYIAKDSTDFAQKAIALYQNEKNWIEFQKNGVYLFNKRFKKEKFYPKMIEKLLFIRNNRNHHRSQNFIGAMLRHHHLRSTKFLSKYIEIKNSN